MKNVTITLEEETARWARVEAAKAGKSLSRWVGERLAEIQGRQESQLAAVERFLAGPELTGAAGEPGWREEMYAERLFRRHERVPVRKRSKVS